jgi:hypothetical protein
VAGALGRLTRVGATFSRSSGESGLGQLRQLPQAVLQLASAALGAQPGELFLEIANSSPQVCHLVEEATLRECTYMTEKGLGHLVSLHA